MLYAACGGGGARLALGTVAAFACLFSRGATADESGTATGSACGAATLSGAGGMQLLDASALRTETAIAWLLRCASLHQWTATGRRSGAGSAHLAFRAHTAIAWLFDCASRRLWTATGCGSCAANARLQWFLYAPGGRRGGCGNAAGSASIDHVLTYETHLGAYATTQLIAGDRFEQLLQLNQIENLLNVVELLVRLRARSTASWHIELNRRIWVALLQCGVILDRRLSRIVCLVHFQRVAANVLQRALRVIHVRGTTSSCRLGCG